MVVRKEGQESSRGAGQGLFLVSPEENDENEDGYGDPRRVADTKTTELAGSPAQVSLRLDQVVKIRPLEVGGLRRSRRRYACAYCLHAHLRYARCPRACL
jgi:hypothetical protein